MNSKQPNLSTYQGKRRLELNSCRARTGVITADEKQPHLNKNTSYTEGIGEKEGQENHAGTSTHLVWAKRLVIDCKL